MNYSILNGQNGFIPGGNFLVFKIKRFQKLNTNYNRKIGKNFVHYFFIIVRIIILPIIEIVS